MELAEDGKIYVGIFSNAWSSDSAVGYLDVIHRPNGVGTQCNYQECAVYLDGKHSFGNLPYVFEYDLGVWAGSPCDPNAVGLSDVIPNTMSCSLYPNPAHSEATLQWSGIAVGNFYLRDMVGRVVYQTELNTISGKLTIPLQALPKGMYLWAAGSRDKMQQGKLVVE
jgi:hypothetical protein